MSLWESVLMALDGLRANKLRSTLTMLGVIIGVAAVIAMISIGHGAQKQTMEQIEKMGTNVLLVRAGRARQGMVRGDMGSGQTLTLDDAMILPKVCPDVVKVAPEVSRNAQVKWRNQNTSTTIRGTTPDYETVRNFPVSEGRFFNERELKSMSRIGVIGQTAAANIFGEMSPINKYIRVKGIGFKIVGVLAFKGAQGWQDPDDQIIIPITTAMKRVFGIENEAVQWIGVQTASMDRSEMAIEQITEALKKQHGIGPNSEADFDIRSQAEIAETASEATKTFTMLLASIASVSLLVGGIGIMNIMLVTVTERTREIGIRKAIGARRRDILLQFLIEAMVLSLFGGILGILLGVGVSRLIASTAGWRAEVEIQAVLLAFGFSAAVGIFFGLYPARKAAQLNPIEALRYE
ncbi:MAG: ABC transporter permease [Armatimonadetes bacterium]|nr:ABC transporter permease [Armatimonadota bacterium]